MRQLRRDDNGDARTSSDDVSRVQRALRGCDDSKDYEVKEIGEEGRGGYSEWLMVCQPHFTNWLTYCSVSLALRDHICNIRHAAPKFQKFQTPTTSTADSQPATSRTISICAYQEAMRMDEGGP